MHNRLQFGVVGWPSNSNNVGYRLRWPKFTPVFKISMAGTHDGLSRRGRRIPTSSVRLAMGKQTNARGAWSAADVASPPHRPSCSNRVLPGLPLGDKSCCVRLSSKADMALEQHCLQTLLSRGAVCNTDGATSHARRLILRLSL